MVHAMTYYKALHGLNIMVVVDVMACYETFSRVKLTIVVDAIACYGTLVRVELTISIEELTSFIIFSPGKKPRFETQAFKYMKLKINTVRKTYGFVKCPFTL